MANNTSKVTMAGAFPPPVHGMAAVNRSVYEALCAEGVCPLVLNMAARSLEQSVSVRLGRIPRLLRALLRLAITPTSDSSSFYISASVYDSPLVLLARLKGMHIFVHHHVSAYIDRPNALARLLFRVAGRNALHVTQSRGMATRLQRTFGVHHALPVSNSVFLADTRGTASKRSELKTLGFMSNICTEKGIFIFLDLVEAANERGLSLKALIAGPFQDSRTEALVRERLSMLAGVEYVGPKYGDDKEAFLADVDAFIFPTIYENETEGIVNLEAMGSGAPVIAYGRGSIPEIVDRSCGEVIDPENSFLPQALQKIEEWVAHPDSFQSASAGAATKFEDVYRANEYRWQLLLADLIHGTQNSLGEEA